MTTEATTLQKTALRSTKMRPTTTSAAFTIQRAASLESAGTSVESTIEKPVAPPMAKLLGAWNATNAKAQIRAPTLSETTSRARLGWSRLRCLRRLASSSSSLTSAPPWSTAWPS